MGDLAFAVDFVDVGTMAGEGTLGEGVRDARGNVISEEGAPCDMPANAEDEDDCEVEVPAFADLEVDAVVAKIVLPVNIITVLVSRSPCETCRED